MPLYRTGPDIALDDLIARIESDAELVIQMTYVEDHWVILTRFPDKTEVRQEHV